MSEGDMMVYSVHGYYGKYGSRKQQNKIEAIVFARDSLLAESLVKEMFDGYPATFSAFTVVGGNEMDLEKIYAERPELMRVSPDEGYVYSEFAHKRTIARYFK